MNNTVEEIDSKYGLYDYPLKKDNTDEMRCPFCRRKIDRHVKKCICGMEFK